MTPPSPDKGLREEVADQSIPEVWSAGTARLVSGWRDGESRALAIAVMALRSIESREPVTHELTLAHEMAQSARDALTLIGEVMEHRILGLPALSLSREGWRPIETAPKDGTPFLTFTPDDTFSAITGIEVMWFDSQLGLVFGPDCLEPVFEPTHWMPLPEPPAAAPQARTETDAPLSPGRI